MDKKTEDELKEMAEERIKWKHFFEILTRKYVLIPVLLIGVGLLESPPIPILNNILKFLKKLGGF